MPTSNIVRLFELLRMDTGERSNPSTPAQRERHNARLDELRAEITSLLREVRVYVPGGLNKLVASLLASPVSIPCPLTEYNCADPRCLVHHPHCDPTAAECWHGRSKDEQAKAAGRDAYLYGVGYLREHQAGELEHIPAQEMTVLMHRDEAFDAQIARTRLAKIEANPDKGEEET